MRRGRRIKTAFVTGSLLAGCGSGRDEQPTDRPASVAIERSIARDAVDPARPVRPILYTWTTREQIEEMRVGRRLLIREESPTRGASYYELVVRGLAQRGDSIAQLLDTTTFAKLRFAWHAPWATRMGLPGEQYGDQLVRVRLASDAIVLSLATSTGTFTAMDLRGRAIARAEVLAHPERIAAVYFASDGAAAAGVPRPATIYREVVLCNEAAIAEWSVGTADIVAELASEAAMLQALADRLPAGKARASIPRDTYEAALAFSGPTLDATTLRDLVALLRDTPQAAPFENGRRIPFPGIGARRGDLRIVPVRKRGTFGTYY